jgi:hypothetical protein
MTIGPPHPLLIIQTRPHLSAATSDNFYDVQTPDLRCGTDTTPTCPHGARGPRTPHRWRAGACWLARASNSYWKPWAPNSLSLSIYIYIHTHTHSSSTKMHLCAFHASGAPTLPLSPVRGPYFLSYAARPVQHAPHLLSPPRRLPPPSPARTRQAGPTRPHASPHLALQGGVVQCYGGGSISSVGCTGRGCVEAC